MWDIYIHPNQGENGNEFALSVFPVKSSSEDRLPENYKLKYDVSTSLTPAGHIDDDQKAVSRFDHAWYREIDAIVYDADVCDMSLSHSKPTQQQIDWRSTMERLAFSTNDVLQYNCDEDSDYFVLYVSIKTVFIKKATKRSNYIGVLGAILLQSEGKNEELCKKNEALLNKKDEYVQSLERQLQNANKLNFELTNNTQKLTQICENELKGMQLQIENNTNRDKQTLTQKEKQINALQQELVLKNEEIMQLNQQITKFRTEQRSANSMNQMFQLLQSQISAPPTQQQLLRQQAVQQRQYRQQQAAFQNLQNMQNMSIPSQNPFGSPQQPQQNNVQTASQQAQPRNSGGSAYNAFPSGSPSRVPPPQNNMNSTIVIDGSPHTTMSNHSNNMLHNQSPSQYQANIISQPQYSTYGNQSAAAPISPPKPMKPPIVMASASPQRNASFDTNHVLNMPDLETPMNAMKISEDERAQRETYESKVEQQPVGDNNNVLSQNTPQQQVDKEEESSPPMAKISEVIDHDLEELEFQHRPVRAWRWDPEQHKWRGRGRGQLSLYYHKEKGLAKILFVDEKHDRTRLLQYVDGSEYAKNDGDDMEMGEVKWNGADYTMDVDNPWTADWKLAFGADEDAAKEFMQLFNQHIEAFNAKDDEKDTQLTPNESNISTQPFFVSNDDNDTNKSPQISFTDKGDTTTDGFASNTNNWASMFATNNSTDKGDENENDKQETTTTNVFGGATTGNWSFQTNDDSADKVDESGKTGSSFGDIKWDFTPDQSLDTAGKQTNESTANESTKKKEENDEDNASKITFKPIVTLEEQTVDSGHENEECIATIKFQKLYRFGKDVSQVPCWKIRATHSSVSFYKSKQNGKVRMIAREDQTEKLRMNQFVPKVGVAAFQLKQARAYSWNAYDSSIAAEEEDEKSGFCAWTIKFETNEYAEQFAAEFTKAMNVNAGIGSPQKQTLPKKKPEMERIPTANADIAEQTKDEVKDENEQQNDEENDAEKYKGWTEEEIAADKLRIEKAKKDAESAKLFSSNTDGTNQTTSWNMNPFEFNAGNNDNDDNKAMFSFEDGQRGVDLEAEAVMNKIKVDGTISFGVSNNDDGNKPNETEPDFSNVTTRNSTSESSGLGMANFSFGTDDNNDNTQQNDASKQEKPETVSSWGNKSNEETNATTTTAGWDIGGGFSSVKPTEGFGNVQWGDSDNQNSGFGSFNDAANFDFGNLITNDGDNQTSTKKEEEKVKETTNANADDEDNGNFTLKPIVSLEEVDVATGHEQDKKLREFYISKLYRWGKDVSGQATWKNRATKTQLEFYQNSGSGKIRIVARENITSKLRMNQNVTGNKAGLNLQRKSEKQISWSGFDLTIEEEDQDDKKGYCLFAAKFTDKETADEFEKFMISSSQNNENL